MCGHIGIIYKGLNGFHQYHIRAFYEGLYIDALRGEDATGICAVFNDGHAEILKESSDAFYFLQDKAWSDIQAPLVKDGKALLGHNRKATVGSLKDENAHPFAIEDDFVFMHNGSLYNWKQLGYDTEVDSEALGHHIRNSIRKEVPMSEALSNVWGAYACVWYDMVSNKVQIVRNSERPLYIIEGDNCFVYCSELEMGQLVCKRNNITIKGADAVPISTLVTFDLDTPSDKLRPSLLPLTITRPFVNPASTPNPGGKPQVITTANYAEEISQKKFKRFRNKVINQPYNFWVDDYHKVPKMDNMIKVIGAEDEPGLNCKVTIVSYVYKDEIDVYNEYYGAFVQGTVQDVFLNEDTNEVLVIVNQLRTVDKSEVALV